MFDELLAVLISTEDSLDKTVQYHKCELSHLFLLTRGAKDKQYGQGNIAVGNMECKVLLILFYGVSLNSLENQAKKVAVCQS